MADITFDMPASGSCIPGMYVYCTGEHDLTAIDKVARTDVKATGYRLAVAYRVSPSGAWTESDGEINYDNGSWRWPATGAQQLAQNTYDFRARLYFGVGNEIKDTEGKTGVQVGCTTGGNGIVAAMTKLSAATHNAYCRDTFYDPAQCDYVIGVLYKRDRRTPDNPNPEWVPASCAQAEITCVRKTRVDVRVTLYPPGPGKYLFTRLFMLRPGMVGTFLSEIVELT